MSHPAAPQPHQRAASGWVAETLSCPPAARRARASPPCRGRGAAVEPGARPVAVIFDLELEHAGRRAAGAPSAVALPSAAPRCSAPPAAHDRREWRCRSGPAAPRPTVRTTTAMPICFSTVGRYHSIVLLEARLIEDRRMQRLGQAAHVVERRLRQLADLPQLGPERRALGRLPAGAAEHGPIAVRIWPNSSCSSREMSLQRRFAGCNQLLRELAPLGRERRELREQPAIGPNQVQARERDRDQRRGQKPVDLALDLVVDVLDARRGLLLARVVFDQQPGHRRAQRRLACLQRQPDLRRAPRPPGRLRASANIRSTASQNCASEFPRYWRCSGVRRATATSSSRRSASVEIEHGCARTAPTRRSTDRARRRRACRASPGRAN